MKIKFELVARFAGTEHQIVVPLSTTFPGKTLELDASMTTETMDRLKVEAAQEWLAQLTDEIKDRTWGAIQDVIGKNLDSDKPKFEIHPEEPHAFLCFHHGGSGDGEAYNREHGYICPKCCSPKVTEIKASGRTI